MPSDNSNERSSILPPKPSLSAKQAKAYTPRSYVLREGRITRAQQHAYQQEAPKWRVSLDSAPIQLDKIFGREAPCLLEIGFGAGEALLSLAKQFPEVNFLGIEVFKPGIGNMVKQVQQQDLKNIRLVEAEARFFIDEYLPDGCVDEVMLLFPDPWPKLRQRKRRLVKQEFLSNLAIKVKASGLLHIATDNQDYAEQITALMHDQSYHWSQLSERKGLSCYRPDTRYQRRGQRLGNELYEVNAQRQGS